MTSKFGQPAAGICHPVVEVRQYTLTPGSFPAFIDLFERHFIEGQEANGIAVIGTFRVLEDPNRFFWIRGFQDMDARKASLTAFYDGPIWKAHKDVANSMLVENDNVLLLRPARAGSGFSVDSGSRAAIGANAERSGLLVASIYSLGSVDAQSFDQTFQESIRPTLSSAGAQVIATLVTEHSENTYPRLPVRSDANVYAWFSCFENEEEYGGYLAALASNPKWTKIREKFALWRMYSPPEVWSLAATPRSALRCS